MQNIVEFSVGRSTLQSIDITIPTTTGWYLTPNARTCVVKASDVCHYGYYLYRGWPGAIPKELSSLGFGNNWSCCCVAGMLMLASQYSHRSSGPSQSPLYRTIQRYFLFSLAVRP